MHRTAVLSLSLIVAGSCAIAAANPVPDGPLRAGYEQLYQGDRKGAQEYFRALAAREPNSLGAAFGGLLALHHLGLRDEGRQKEFERGIDQLIKTAAARYDRSKKDMDALFYLAQAYTWRGRYRYEHDKGIWSAARDAAKAKGYGEEYAKIDPGRADADYALGIYNYYVDIAPSFVKFLRVLLFLPKGGRVEGLKQLERAAREAELWGPLAQDTLRDIYASLESRVEDAVRMAEGLQKRYPENPEYRFALAGLYSNAAMEEYRRAAEQYNAIVARVDQAHPNYKPEDRYRAVSALSRVEQQQWRLDDAIAVLDPVVAAAPASPDWVVPNFLLTRSNLRGLLNDPRAAEDARRVLAEPKWQSRHKNAEELLKWIEQRRASGEAAVYAELIPANRLAGEHRWDEARAAYESVRARHPDDPQVRFRLAQLEFNRGDDSKAEAGFSSIMNAGAKTPAWLRSSAMLYVARIQDLRGRRDEALHLYKRIAAEYEHESAASGARAGMVAPYRRRSPTASK